MRIKKALDPVFHQKQQISRYKSDNRRKLAVIAMLGGKCVSCQETNPRVLQVNHKNGGGLKELRGQLNFYTNILAGRRKIDDLDLRCANCNILYEYECGRKHWLI
jgi:hypothetical protein